MVIASVTTTNIELARPLESYFKTSMALLRRQTALNRNGFTISGGKRRRRGSHFWLNLTGFGLRCWRLNVGLTACGKPRIRGILHRLPTIATQQNREDSTSSWQYGGRTVTLRNQLAHSVKSKGTDRTGLRRWAWIRLRGRTVEKYLDELEFETEGAVPTSVSQDLIVISACIPNSAGKGSSTIWRQSRDYFLPRGRTICPRTAFVEDLTSN